MERKGFTILELLVVLSLLVVVTGLVMPSVMERMGATVLESATSRIEGAAAMCRAEAQRRGLPVRMVARVDGRGVVSIYAERIELEGAEVGSAGQARLLDPDLAEDPMPAPRAEGPVYRNVSVYTLPEGYRFDDEPPAPRFESFRDPGAVQAGGGGAFADGGARDDLSTGGGDVPAPVQLALYLPDGSAVVTSPLYLIVGGADDQRAFTVSLSRWSGGCEVKPMPVRQRDPFGGLDAPSESRAREAPGATRAPNAPGAPGGGGGV